MRYFRGAKNKVCYDPVRDTNYVRVLIPPGHVSNGGKTGRSVWYRFSEKSGELSYVPEDRVPERVLFPQKAPKRTTKLKQKSGSTKKKSR